MIEYRALRSKIKEQTEPPVKVVPLAHSLGLRIFKVEGWENKLSGMIKKDAEDGGDSGYAIYVNGDHSETRRRFTIAHEIAHFVLHKSLIGDGIIDDALYRSGFSNYIETEAKDLATDILMPPHLVRKATRKESSIEKLAEIFNVSREAMAIRLKVAQE